MMSRDTARIVELVNRVGLGHPPLAVSTVGMLQPYPGSRNVIPGEVKFSIDLRNVNDALLKRAAECAAAEARFVSDAHGSAAYKKELLRVYLPRAIKEALS